MTHNLLMGTQVLAIVVFLLCLGSFRHPRVRPLTFLIGGAALLVLTGVGVSLVQQQPWLVTICAGFAGVLVAGAVVWRATLANIAIVHLTLVGLMACASAIAGTLLLATQPPGALGTSAVFHVLVGLSTTVAAGLAAGTATASVFASNLVPGPLNIRFRAWWAPASVLVATGVIVVVASSAALWAGPVALLCGALAGVALTIASPVSIPRAIPAAIAAVGLVVMVQGAAMSSFVVVTIAGVCAGVGAAAYRVVAASAAIRSTTDSPDVVAMAPADAAVLLNTARRVVIVPGYDVAVRGEEHLVADIVTALDRSGTTVCVAAHPAAGRLPGIMTTLLLDAGLAIEQVESDPFVADQQFSAADVALVIGADDVALRDSTDSQGARHGFAVGKSRRVVVLPGTCAASGVEKFQDEVARRTAVVPGDLTASLLDVKRALVSY